MNTIIPRSCRLASAIVLFCIAANPTTARSQSPALSSPVIELKNGSLENSDGAKRPNGWQFVGRGGGTLRLDEDRPFEGKCSAQLDATHATGAELFTNLMQAADATGARSKRVRFRATVRTAELAAGASVQLWFRVDRKADASGQAQIGAFDNMQDRPIASAEWQQFEIVLPVAEDAERLNVGIFLVGQGKAWFDAASLAIVDDKTATTGAKISQHPRRRPPISPILQKAFAEAENTPQQPFFTHWLWLALVAIMLSVLAMLGPLPAPPAAVEEAAVSEPPDIDFVRKFALRFAVIYWGAYGLPSMLAVIPWVGMPLSHWYSVAKTFVAQKMASDLFALPGKLVPPNGSGDTTYSYLTMLATFAMAIAGASLWSLIARRKTDYSIARDLLRSYLRWVLALAALGYGLAKVTLDAGGNQFPVVGPYQLDKTWGASSPMNVLWAFMGASRPYTIFAGLGEIAAALLLIWRRTALLGALVAFGIMVNVMMLNYCYDVPVKIYSTHLALMSLLILLPEAPRLTSVFLLNRTAPSIFLPGLWGRGKLATVRLAVKVVVIGCLFALPLGMHSWEISKQLAATRKAAESNAPAQKYRLTSRGYRWINEVPFNR